MWYKNELRTIQLLQIGNVRFEKAKTFTRNWTEKIMHDFGYLSLSQL